MHNALIKGCVNVPDSASLLAPSVTLGNIFFPLAGRTVLGQSLAWGRAEAESQSCSALIQQGIACPCGENA